MRGLPWGSEEKDINSFFQSALGALIRVDTFYFLAQHVLCFLQIVWRLFLLGLRSALRRVLFLVLCGGVALASQSPWRTT